MENQLRATPPSVNHGFASVEQERAIAEARGQMQLAKMFPRDLNAAHAELMESCRLPALANAAFYTLPRGGQSISGPSIRLAEEIARVCGNIEYGHRELGRDADKSEVEVFAWDKQTNTRSVRQLTVMHVIDTKNGPKKCRDQTEIDNLIANKASKQLRGRLLAIAPKWLVESAVDECRKTLAGNNDEPLSVRIRKMTQAFSKFGVTVPMLEKYLGHGLDDTLLEELIDLTGVFNAIRDGAAARDYFKTSEPDPQDAVTTRAAANLERIKASKAAENQQASNEPAPVQSQDDFDAELNDTAP